jgi:predicted nicotinamide N-methyase
MSLSFLIAVTRRALDGADARAMRSWSTTCQLVRQSLRNGVAACTLILTHHGGGDSLEDVLAHSSACGLVVNILKADHEQTTASGLALVTTLEFALQPPLVLAQRQERVSPRRGFERLALPDGRLLLLCTVSLGSGGVVWQAAKLLCRWQCSVAHDIRGSRVLELGCGTGCVGLFAAALGASRVLLTDDERPALLELARSNCQINAALYPTASVDVQPLVWGSSSSSSSNRSTAEAAAASATNDAEWDFVLGSDLTYGSHVRRLLCQTVRQLLLPPLRCDAGTPRRQTRRPRVILSHEERPETDGRLASLIEVASEHGLRITELLCEVRQAAPPSTRYVVELSCDSERA